MYYTPSIFFLSSNVIPNIVKQIVLHCNTYMCRLNPDGLPVSPDMVNSLETQVLSIQNPDNKIRALVGNIIILI